MKTSARERAQREAITRHYEEVFGRSAWGKPVDLLRAELNAATAPSS